VGQLQKSIYQERVMEMPQIENLINWNRHNRTKDDLELQSCMRAKSLGHKSPPQLAMPVKPIPFWTCLKFIPRKMQRIQELGLYWELWRAHRTIRHSSWILKEGFKWKRLGWKTCRYSNRMPLPLRGLEVKCAMAQGSRRPAASW
jgi:hypothetical protein